MKSEHHKAMKHHMAKSEHHAEKARKHAEHATEAMKHLGGLKEFKGSTIKPVPKKKSVKG